MIAGGLPVINRPMDNTALSAYMACPREYFLSMVLHRRGEGKSAALAFGGLWHKMLETHYKSGGEEQLVEIVAHGWWEQHGVEAVGDYRTLDRAILDYKKYRERWGKKPTDEQGRTVGWPDEPMVEIAADVMAGNLIHPWAVKIDRIIELGGLYYVEDHKTTSRLDKNYYSAFELSNQMMGYTRIAQYLMPSLKIVGIRLNVFHCIKSGTNFERQLFTYTPDQLEEWELNANGWMQRVSRDMQLWNETYGEGEIPSIDQVWPMAHFGDNGCARKYGLCQYHRVCSVSPRFRRGLVEEMPVNEWNPLEADD